MTSSAEATAYLYHHVVLPYQLPQKDDYDASYECSFFKIAIHALEDLKEKVKDNCKNTVMYAIATVENLRNSRDNRGYVAQRQLQELLLKLAHGEIDGVVPLEIKAQNAAIFVSHNVNSLSFEFFELSPTNEAAMQPGRLKRTFPGLASSIPISKATSPQLCHSLAATIAKMATQKAPGFQPQVRKNKMMIDEDRDSTKPGLVTDLLMNMIAALGETIDVKRITKCTREEVLWSDCLNPWRRSPLWLLLRVSLQLLFVREGEKKKSPDELYKAFMLFVLSHLLDLARKHLEKLGSEALHSISSKMTRRLRKMELLDQSEYLELNWMMPIQIRIENAHTLIDRHWQNIVSGQGYVDTAPVRNIKPESDLYMNLEDLDTLISEAATRHRGELSISFQTTSTCPGFSAVRLPDDLSGPEEDKIFRLLAFEKWVEQHLHSWVVSRLHDVETCGQLRRLMKMYHNIASATYEGLPVGISVMYLTLAEIWVACDTSACRIFPLLSDYDPEVDLAEFECLALPLKTQLERLQKIELYAKSRRNRSVKGLPSIYREFGHALSFAVKYFDGSQILRNTLWQIEQEASAKREKKYEELKALKREYADLMNRYDNSVCETWEKVIDIYHGYTKTEHKHGCARCQCRYRADNLSIRIYEWPVSSNPSIAKATVFESTAPQTFFDWRDFSMYFIATVLGSRDSAARKPQYSFTLEKHTEFSKMLPAQYSERRIVPLSEVKPHIVTHRNHKKAVSYLSNDDVCLENALKFAYFDKTQGVLITGVSELTEEIPKKCLYRMPPHSKNMERFMYKPPSRPDGLPANEVIASLSDCPAHISIDEYKALGVLPLGRQISYLNILVQLAISTVDFTKVEMQCFILQMIQQVGTPAEQQIERLSHRIVKTKLFGQTMLEQLGIALQRMTENWESWRALATFSLLARRVLSLSTSSIVRGHSLNYLTQLRNVCMKWLQRLKKKVQDSTDNDQCVGLHSRAVDIALLCTSTFDVEDCDIEMVLMQPSATSILLQCSITIQEKEGSVEPEFPYLFKTMLQSWKSLMSRAMPQLRKIALQDSSEICDAITVNWAAFRPEPSKCWASLKEPYENWVHIMSGSLSVHLNLFTAELLVNGTPLARLPSEFTRHTMYQTLFKNHELEVMPTDEPGMRFSAKTPFYGYRLHFGMAFEDILVLAVGENERLELLPPRVFQDQLPQAFVVNFVHWYDRTRDEVLFRPREAPWASVTNGWRLKRDSSANPWYLIKESNVLVSMMSISVCILSKLFQSLEDPQHLHIIFDTASQIIDIELPRLQLSFYVKHADHEIHSRQYRGSIIDTDQRINTLIGLKSKLVIRNRTSYDRQILIPVPRSFNHSPIAYTKRSPICHTTVTIDRESTGKVYAYSLDKDLRRILDCGELQSQLLMCYLHGLTSHCLPDPFLYLTGTESALKILNSAAVRSFDVLTLDNIELLAEIASLSPVRSFYPLNERVMQQTKWDPNLPSLSQHGAFRTSVEDILDHAAQMQLFYPGHSIFDTISAIRPQFSSDRYLDKRSSVRSSMFRVSGFGAEDYNTVNDFRYQTRDTQQNSERGQRAFIAASLVLRDQAALHSSVPDLKNLLLQTHFEDTTVEGIETSFHPSSLRFDAKWLEDSSTVFRKLWCSFHHGLATASSSCNKYEILAWLSIMAYAESADMTTIQTLVAFYRFPEFITIQPPSASIFKLSKGDTFEPSKIRSVVEGAKKSYAASEESRLPKQGSETDAAHLRRIQALFQERQNSALLAFTSDLQQQWPARNVTISFSEELKKYFNIDARP